MSADNAIAVLRTRKPGGGYEFRLADYGVSGEPFTRRTATAVSVGKAESRANVARLFGDVPEEAPFVVVDGFCAITPRDAQYFVGMFAKSPVFDGERAAMDGATRLEEEIGYVEYGSERVCIDSTWGELEARAEALRQRRLTCKVLGPNAEQDGVSFNWDRREDFKNLGGPGIEDKLAQKWGWQPEVVEAVMERVMSKYFDWNRYTDASHLRIARAGNAEEEARYQRQVQAGCCQRHDEDFVVHTLCDGDVRVKFGFNHGH